MPEQPKADAVAWLVRLSVTAGVVWTAVSEWQLARIIGAPNWVAPALPLAIDAYVVAAVFVGRRRDLAGALAIMSCAQIAARLLDAGQVQVSIALVSLVSILVPLTIWRVHALADDHEVQVRPEPAEPQVRPNQGEPAANRSEPAANLPAEPPANQVREPAEPAEPQRPNLKRTSPKRTKPTAGEPARRTTKATNPGTPSVTEQVRQVLDLIEEHGVDAVKLGFLMEQTGWKKTAAYDRLIEARATWSEEHPDGT